MLRPDNVVAKLTGNLVIARPRRVRVQGDFSSLRGPETSGRAVLRAGQAVPPLGRYSLVRGHIVAGWPWQLFRCCLATSQHSAEIWHAAVFVFGIEVLPVFADGKRSAVFARPWNADLFFVFLLYFP